MQSALRDRPQCVARGPPPLALREDQGERPAPFYVTRVAQPNLRADFVARENLVALLTQSLTDYKQHLV